MNPKVLNTLLFILISAGIVAAGVLSYGHATGIEVPCGLKSTGCRDVQLHPSSKLFGIPWAYIGVAAYLGFFAVTILRLHSGPQQRLWLNLGFGMSAVGALGSIGLQVYSFAVIKAQCNWCIASALIMCGIFVLHAILWNRADEAPEATAGGRIDFRLVGVLLVAAIGSVMLIGAQGKESNAKVVNTDRIDQDPVEFLTKGAPSVGPEDAPVIVVEFADMFCPMCRTTFHSMKEDQQKYSGKLRWVFRHFPLFSVEGHEFSLPTAVAAEYAGRQGKFWEFVSKVYEADLTGLESMDGIYTILESLNVDRAGAQAAIDNENSPELNRVAEDLRIADKIGIQETPTFILIVRGERPVAMRKTELERRLNDPKIQALLKE